ncbi:unnamed protein product [Withania somnifera]
MTLRLYVDRFSHPCREVIIFCKLNGIDFEEVCVELSKGQHLTPEFEDVNPLKQIPAIVDGEFKLSESHAILRYLVSAFPGIADHWYPADLYKRVKVESMLDWHRSNFPRGQGGYVFRSIVAPAIGLPLNPQAASEVEEILIVSLATIESVWLQQKGQFLLGNDQPSIADLSLACEIMQFELLDEEDRERILGPFKRVLKWLGDTKNAMAPHFEEVHSILYDLKEKFQNQRRPVGR